MKRIAQTILVVATFALTSVAWSQEAGNHEALTKDDIAEITKTEYSPYAGRNFRPGPCGVTRTCIPPFRLTQER